MLNIKCLVLKMYNIKKNSLSKYVNLQKMCSPSGEKNAHQDVSENSIKQFQTNLWILM